VKFKYIPKYDLSHLLKGKAGRGKVKPPFAWYTLIATWFYVGVIGFMPGTLGSIASYPLFYVAVYGSDGYESAMMRCWMIFIPLFFIGWLAVRKFEEKTFTHDHKSVVIDEVLGMMLCFAICFDKAYLIGQALKPYFSIKPSNLAFLITLIVFRYYDIKKPLFIRTIDQRMRSSFSVILDDLVAAIFSVMTIIIAEMIISKVL
jgi:phosphatidylglycerophosphatase A